MVIDIAGFTAEDVARRMDYAILGKEYGAKQYLEGCETLKRYRFVAYHVLPCWIPLVVSEVGAFARENRIEIGAPVAFPYGAAPSPVKFKETEVLIEQGATALDMVANVGWLKDGRFDDYQTECNRHVQLCHDAGINAKIIIEVGCLTKQEVVTATKMVAEAGADFVKTATGTSVPGRPDFDDVRAILTTLADTGTTTGLKVSGIVEPKIPNAYAFIRMGAARIGTRAAPAIVDALPTVQTDLFPV